MVNQFAPFEMAVKLKELGFDEKCLTSYTPEGKLMSIWAIDDSNIEGEQFANKTKDILYCRNSTNINGYIAAPLWQQVYEYIYPNFIKDMGLYTEEVLNFKYTEKFENYE